MKKYIVSIFIVALLSSCVSLSQINQERAVSGISKVIQAATITDEQMAEYVKEYISETDAKNKICGENNSYTKRLKKLTTGLTDANGIPLNFKVYNVNDVNAFACPDGSIRVYSGLMDIMSDDEVLGVIGHEIGHIANRDSKNAFKNSLLTSALKDGIASTSNSIATLTDSQLGALGEFFLNAKYSQKQEFAADEYGYEFLKKCNKNPYAMVLSFKKLQQLQGKSSSKSSVINQLFSTHPELEKRIEKMEKRAKSDGYIK
jgi:putative metalloprotease